MNSTDKRRNANTAVARVSARPMPSALPWLMLVTLLLALGFGSNAKAAGDVEAGGIKVHSCLGCHGVKHYVNSYPTYHVPRIAGQHEAYLVSALKAYRDKTRSHPTMQANAGLLSDQDIEDIAAWLSAAGGK